VPNIAYYVGRLEELYYLEAQNEFILLKNDLGKLKIIKACIMHTIRLLLFHLLDVLKLIGENAVFDRFFIDEEEFLNISSMLKAY
jgi:hypothetical protein